MSVDALIVVAVAAALGMMVSLWIASLILKDASIVDPFWGIGFAWIALVVAVTTGGIDARGAMVLAAVTIWGGRLSAHIHTRNRGHGEDYRYVEMRRHHGRAFWWYSLISVFLLQGAIMALVSAPLAIVMGSPGSTLLGWADALGLFVWGSGVFFETVGDAQLRAFRADATNRGKVLDTGLWGLTRHPNYFGDLLVWTGFFIIATSVPGGAWTFASPLVMGFFLRYVSGVALLEKKLRETKPGYADYMDRVPAFVPNPLRLIRR